MPRSILSFSLLLALAPCALSQETRRGEPDAAKPAPRAPTEIEAEELKDELLQRRELDQEVRRIDYSKLEDDARRAAMIRWTAIDEDNTAWLEGVVDTYGWPTISMVGKEASNAAFLIAQHADRKPEFQARCLPLLVAAAERDEVSKTGVAYLTDRIRVAQGRPQVYGTQYSVEKDANGGVVTDDQGEPVYALPLVVDVDQLDARRKEMGLGPWFDYEKRMAQMQGREPAQRPRGVEKDDRQK